MKKLMFSFLILVLSGIVAQAGMELTSARVYRKQGDFKQALEWYNREIEAHPNSVAGHYEKGELLGQMADEQGKTELFLEMRKEFDAVLNLADEQPKKVKKYRSKIKELVEKYWIFQYNDAVEKFRLAESDSALEAAAKSSTGDTWETLESAKQDSLREAAKKEYWEQSRKVLDITLAIDPERWETYALLSNIQSAVEDMEAAESSLRRAIEYHAKLPEAEESEESRSARRARYDEERERFISDWEAEQKIRVEHPNGEVETTKITTTTKLRPKPQMELTPWERTHIDMLGNLAQVSFELKKYKETIGICDEIMAIDPQDLLAIKLIAFSWNQLGENQKAIDAYKQAIAAQPDNTDLLYNAGQLYMQAGDTVGAMKCFSDFIANDPTDFEVIFQLGVIYLEGGTFTDNDKAKELFGNATEHFPDNPVIWTNYGVALIRAGETEEGKKAIEKAKVLKGE